MRFIITLVLVFMLGGCTNFIPTPTPNLYKHLVAQNDAFYKHFLECSRIITSVSEEDACSKESITKRANEIRSEAKELISRDIRQVHGYDIYLNISMVLFSIAKQNTAEYSEAQRIARQFFEIQKASGRSQSNLPGKWLILITTEYITYIYNTFKSLTQEDLEKLDFALEIYPSVFNAEKDARIQIRLLQSKLSLEYIKDKLSGTVEEL